MDKKKLLVVVDMQNDFIDGSLGTDAACAVVERVCKKLDDWDGRVCFTMDTHYEDYPETIEGAHIPVPHCISDTPGWRLNQSVEARKNADSFVVYKESFGTTDLINIVNMLEIEQVQLVGVCTDICVISNALLLRSSCPQIQISVDASCCAGTTPENHAIALVIMRQCCVDVLNCDAAE